MKLTDIYPLDKWIELEEELSNRSGLSANVFDTDGIRISDFHMWPNRLCPAIKGTDKGQSFICAVAHMNLAEQAKQSGESVIEECDAGLVKILVPVFVNSDFIGAVGACGLILDDGEVESFLVNKITEIDEEKVERLSEGIGVISSNQAESLKTYIEGEVKKIVEAYEASLTGAS